VLFRTYVVIHGQPPQPLILIRRGAWFLYLVGLAGIVVALAVLFMLAFHTVKLDDYKTTLSLGAGAWALTTGEVFSRFFAQLAEEAPPQG
jgi:hypothetical protein